MGFTWKTWKNEPSTDSPINANNLNRVEDGIQIGVGAKSTLKFNDKGQDTFFSYGNFEHYGLLVSGDFQTSQLYRVSNNDKLCFDRDLIVSVANGYKWGYVEFSSMSAATGTWKGWYQSSQQILVKAGTVFQVQITTNPEVTSVIANVVDYTNAVTFESRSSKTLAEIESIEGILNNIDLVNHEECEMGLLQSDGTVSKTYTAFMTTGFIAVEIGKEYFAKVEKASGSGTYSLYVAEYDENNVFLVLKPYTVNLDGFYYIPTSSSVKFVRMSFSTTNYNSGFTLKEGTNLSGKLDKTNVIVNDINTYLLITNFAKLAGFTEGLLNATGSVDVNASFKTTNFIPVDSSIIYNAKVPSLDGPYTLYMSTYDANYGFIERKSISAHTSGYEYTPSSDIGFVRFSVSNTIYNAGFVFTYKQEKLSSIDNSLEQIEESQINAETIYTYSGTELPLGIENKYCIQKVLNNIDISTPSGKTSQGFAVFGNVLFQFMSEDMVRLYDMEKEITIADIELTCGHGNSAVFTNTYYDSEDEFPEVYVSDTDGTVYLERISRSSASLIKTFFFDSATFGYKGQFALDVANNIGYLIANTADSDTIRTAKVTKCDMSNLTDNGDGTYTPEVLETFNVTLQGTTPILQGVKFKNGHLFLPSGGYATTVLSLMNIIKISTQSVVNYLDDFPEIMSLHELEDIDFIYNKYNMKYDILAWVREYGYYRMMF